MSSVQTTTQDPLVNAQPEGPALKVRVTQAPLYATAISGQPAIATLPYLAHVQPLGQADGNGLVPIVTAEGRRGYCRMEHLADAKARLFAKVPPLLALSAVPNSKDPPRDSQLVDVRQAEPGICIDLVFASTRNFTGIQLYARDICLLQKATLEKLGRAQQRFRRDGYSIKIYDAYRPYSVTVRLAEINSNPTYLANPLIGSTHNRGAAVDMTVVDAKGIELEMPSPMHTMDKRSSRENPAMTPAARQNLAYVQDIMMKSGFVPYAAEWWHYTDSESSRYPHLDLSLSDIDMQPGSPLKSSTPPPIRDPRQTGYVSVPLALVPTPTPGPSPTPGVVTTRRPSATPVPSRK